MRIPLSLAFAVIAAFPAVAAAQTVSGSMHPDHAELQLMNDLYVAGESVGTDTYSGGDLNIVGSTVSINQNISGDLQAAGSTVSVDANVSDNVRVAGSTVHVSGVIDGNLLVFGGTVLLARGAVVHGDVIAAGGEVTLSGRVDGNVRAYGDQVTIEGPVGGSLDVEAEKFVFLGTVAGDAKVVANDWHLGEGAMIENDLTYWHNQPEASFNLDDHVAGAATYDPALRKVHEDDKAAAGAFAAVMGAVSVYMLLSAALVMALLMLLTRTYFRDAAARLDKQPWLALLFGFLFFVVTPSLALLFAMTVIGLPVTAVLLVSLLFAFLFAKPFTAVVLARYIERKAGKTWNGWIVFAVALGVYVALKLVMVVPVLGWIAVMLAIFFAFGASLMTKYDKYLTVR